ncbi:MAG: InlB B-repeat-containing protein [Oscillospiraceae bacterium]
MHKTKKMKFGLSCLLGVVLLFSFSASFFPVNAAEPEISSTSASVVEETPTQAAGGGTSAEANSIPEDTSVPEDSSGSSQPVAEEEPSSLDTTEPEPPALALVPFSTPVQVTIDGTNIYANGNHLIINGNTIAEENASAIEYVDAGGSPIAFAPPASFENYTIYGGAKDGNSISIVNGSKITLTGPTTKVKNLYGGNEGGGLQGSILLTVENGASVTGGVFGGSYNGDINGGISVVAQSSAVANIYGGNNVGGDITGDVSVSIKNNTITAGSIYGGSVGQYLSASNTHLGNIHGNISVNVQNTSSAALYGASAYGEVFGNVTLRVNDEDAANSGTFDTLYGGGGNTRWSTAWQADKNYGNVYGDISVTAMGKTTVGYRFGGGGRQGAVRKNAGGTGGNVTVRFGGSSYAYWLQAAGYYTPTGAIVEGNVVCTIEGKAEVYQVNGSAEAGYVGGLATVVAKDNVKITSLIGGGSDYGGDTIKVEVYGGTIGRVAPATRCPSLDFTVDIYGGKIDYVYSGPTSSSGQNTSKATITVHGGAIGRLYGGAGPSNKVGSSSLTVNGGTVDYVYGGGSTGSITGSVAMNLNGGTIKTVYGSGFGTTSSSQININAPGENQLAGTIYAGGLGTVTDFVKVNVQSGKIGWLLGGQTAPTGITTPKTLPKSIITVAGGKIENLVGGSYVSSASGSMAVEELEISIQNGVVDNLFLGGYVGSSATNNTIVKKATLDIAGGTITSNKIYGHAYNGTIGDAVEDISVGVHKLDSLNYWFYLPSSDLSFAENAISPLDDVASYWVISVPATITEAYESANTGNGMLSPYQLFKNGFTVEYFANGGEGSVPVDGNVYKQGAVAAISGPGELFREGYDFAGWRTTPDDRGLFFAAGSQLTIENADVQLYAQWKEKTSSSGTGQSTSYRVLYNVNWGGLGTTQIDDQTGYLQGQTATLRTVIPVRTGYTFVAWNTRPGGDGTGYTPGGTMVMPANDVTLYAQWRINGSSSTVSGGSSSPNSEPPSSSAASFSANSNTAGNGGNTVIGNSETTPLSGGNSGAWALLNLILTVLGLATAIVLLVGIFLGRKSEKQQEEGYGEDKEEEQEEQRRNQAGLLWRILAIVTAIVSLIVFLVTENMRLPMVWVDCWTILMVALAVVEFIFILVLINSRKKEDREDDSYEDENNPDWAGKTSV